MTIKELEERTGMARANIRFYESEGLISPQRLPNGYRDYSEEDAVTLEKIKLLRELHLDIDTIRLVQKGELTLEQALFALLNRLEADKAAIDRAAQVCRELERSGVEYAALEPRPWLCKLETVQYPRIVEPARPVEPKPEEEPKEYAHGHLWRRYLARMLDTTLFSLPVVAVYLLILDRNPAKAGGFEDWLLGMAGLVFALLWEPLLLRFWGWTPGKWIFGLKLRNRWGKNLSLEEGLFRTVGVLFSGLGLGISVIGLICLLKRRKESKAGDPAPWDGETVYTCEPRRLDWLMWLGGAAACVAVMALFYFWAMLPPNRGSLTEREYYENINACLNWMTTSEARVSETGQWYDAEDVPGRWTLHDRPDIQVDMGKEGIRSVKLISQGSPINDGEILYQDYGGTYQIALVALLAQERVSPTEYGTWTKIFEDSWDSFETEYEGISIVQTVEHSGYDGVGQVLAAREGEAQSYLRTVTITVIGSE